VDDGALACIGQAAFMAVQRVGPGRVKHRVRSLWEADGRGGHRAIFEWRAEDDTFRVVAPVAEEPLLVAATELMAALQAEGPTAFEEVRERVLAWYGRESGVGSR